MWESFKNKIKNIFVFKLELEYLWKLLYLVPLSLILGIILVYVFNVKFDDLGPFGDFVAGSTVPILTLISFLAVVITLRMQNKQLDMQNDQLVLQREELKNSIEEMKAQRLEFEDQNKTLKIQRFENTFFQMVNLHHDIVNSLNISDYYSDEEATGRSGFLLLLSMLRDSHKRYFNDYENYAMLPLKEQVVELWNKFYDENDNTLGHYFRNLYRIVKYIDETNLIENTEDKRIYIGIIRAQLSATELALLVYNALGEKGENFLYLMHKYNLHDNLNTSYFINPLIFDFYLENAN